MKRYIIYFITATILSQVIIAPVQANDFYSDNEIHFYDKDATTGGCGTIGTVESGPATEDLSGFINAYGEAAFNVGKRFGLPYEAILAQAAFESGMGKSALTREAFNFFGIKAGSSWNGPVYNSPTREEVNGQSVTINASFRAYPNAEAGFTGYGEFIRDNPRYAPALQYRSDPISYIQEIAKAGYATDSKYAEKNIVIIRSIQTYIAENNLFPPSSAVEFDTNPVPTTSNPDISGCVNQGDGEKAALIIAIAERELGRNGGVPEYGGTINEYTLGAREPWCADFVSFVFRDAGAPFTGGWREDWQIPSVLTMQSWFQAGVNGSTYHSLQGNSGFVPQPGDVAFYIGKDTPDGGSTRHVNIVVAVSTDGKTMTTIGGNESDTVKKRNIPVQFGEQSLVGFGRINK